MLGRGVGGGSAGGLRSSVADGDRPEQQGAAPRPGFGTAGTSTELQANVFELGGKKGLVIYCYKVSFDHRLSSMAIRQVLGDLVEKKFGQKRPAVCPKYMCTETPLPFFKEEFDVICKELPPRRKSLYKVTISLDGEYNLSHIFANHASLDCRSVEDALRAVEVVLRSSLYEKFTCIGKSFFPSHPELEGDLCGGMKYKIGFCQSVKVRQLGPSLTIDTLTKVLYEPTSAGDLVAHLLDLPVLPETLSENNINKVERFLKGLLVETRHMGYRRVYKITGLSRESARQLRLNKGVTSIEDYFRETYSAGLLYPLLPTLISGTATRPTYLPLEKCTVVEGQSCYESLTREQKGALLEVSKQSLSVKRDRIKQNFAMSEYDKGLVAQDFELHLEKKLASFSGRILPPPTLICGQGERVVPFMGSWDMTNKKMYEGGAVNYWMCVDFSSSREDMTKRFCQRLVKTCEYKGMRFNNEPVLPIEHGKVSRIEDTLVNIDEKCRAKLANSQLQLLIVILPDRPGSYGKIKRKCEIELGIVSQCCRPIRAQQMTKPQMENLALKINVKVGGSNFALNDAIFGTIPHVTDLPTIIFGADVTHSTSRSVHVTYPSIAAVVASMDWPASTKYRSLVSAQEPNKETIEGLYIPKQTPAGEDGGMARELLAGFIASTGRDPERIIFYRDGVSINQQSEVLHTEVGEIRQACASLLGHQLPVTFIIAKKRHHTLLFRNDDKKHGSVGKGGNKPPVGMGGNIPPGTVVDDNICHPTEFDFFLTSHAVIKGGGRPLHYHVLLDENNFNADDLQTLTYNLCYTFARCRNSVSLVPPVYYAHLAAFRARSYVEGGPSPELGPIPVKDNVRDVMFYC